MGFRIEGEHFILNDKKTFLNSGEIHYFRLRRNMWEKHLRAAVEAGLSTVSTYVPWAWHEPEEGVFDFEGKSIPERDLIGWIRLCKEYGLHCIVKPGPFILAEFRGAGLPDWFLENLGEDVRMHNSKGEPVSSEGVSLFHPEYLEKVTRWYDQIMPLISKNELNAGGPIIMMQLCNEIGLFSWLAHQADYGHRIRERFISYLEKKFKGVSEINDQWGTSYSSFADVELPPDGILPYASPGDRGRDYEWHCFWRTYYGDYLRMLLKMARDRGVGVPVYHNLPGWIYGHGYEFPVNITMYQDLYGEKSEIIFGIDHIPEFVSHRNMHDDRIINDITRAMQGNKPLFAAEFQSGSREYHVVTNPRETELFYKASIANGLTGWNYYMFSQGRNPLRKGYSGDTFYWFTPLTAEGKKTSAFPLISRMSKLIKTIEPVILDAKRKADICVLFYPPYYATELERPETGASALQFVPAAIRRPAWFDGLLKVLQILNIDYDMADLSQVSAADLKKYKQVWAFTTDEVDARDQQVIVDYAAAGGHVVIYPCLPDREMSQMPCTIIRDALNIAPDGKDVIDSPLIDILGFKDIKCANPQMTFSEEALKGAEVIAHTLTGKICGFSKALGKGKVIHLGTWLGFDTESNKQVFKALVKAAGAGVRQAAASSENITVRQRSTPSGSAMLFIGNYYNEEQNGKVLYTHPVSGEQFSIPLAGDEILWPPLYGVLSPISMEVLPGLKVLHTTSDILQIKAGENQAKFSLMGERDLFGEMVFEGPKLTEIVSAKLNSKPVNFLRLNDRVVVNYQHDHKKEITLTLKFQ